MRFVMIRTGLAVLASVLLCAQESAAPPKPGAHAGVSSAGEVHSVYLLPMGHGLDQYLATHLVRKGLFKVVANPALADAILTDAIGQGLESKLDELYPKPEEEPKPAAAPAPGAPPPSEADLEEARREETRRNSERAMDKARAEWIAQRSTFGRGKGNFYLVDRYSRVVLWSLYERPKNSQPDVLDKTARRIVSELEKQVRPKKP